MVYTRFKFNFVIFFLKNGSSYKKLIHNINIGLIKIYKFYLKHVLL